MPRVIASCARLNGDGDTIGDRIRFSIGGHALRQGCPREMTETRKLAAILAADVRLRGKPRPRTKSLNRKKRPARTSGPGRKALLSVTQRASRPTPASQDPESPRFVHRGIRPLRSRRHQHTTRLDALSRPRWLSRLRHAPKSLPFGDFPPRPAEPMRNMSVIADLMGRPLTSHPAHTYVLAGNLPGR